MEGIICFYKAKVPPVLLQIFMNPHFLFMITIYLTIIVILIIVILLPNIVLFFFVFFIHVFYVHTTSLACLSTLEEEPLLLPLKTFFLIQIKGLRIEGAVYWCYIGFKYFWATYFYLTNEVNTWRNVLGLMHFKGRMLMLIF